MSRATHGAVRARAPGPGAREGMTRATAGGAEAPEMPRAGTVAARGPLMPRGVPRGISGMHGAGPPRARRGARAGEGRRGRWRAGLAVGALILLGGLALVGTSGDLGGRLLVPAAALRARAAALAAAWAAPATPTAPPATATARPTPALPVAGCGF